MSVFVNSYESKAAVTSLIVFYDDFFKIINLSKSSPDILSALLFNLLSDIRFSFPKQVIRDQNICQNMS